MHRERDLFPGDVGVGVEEDGPQAVAERVDDRDDGDRDAGRDETVFDRGGSGFVCDECSYQRLHFVPSRRDTRTSEADTSGGRLRRG